MSDMLGNKQRLLIVDDSKVIRVTARKILQNHFETVEALDGNNAWDILTSQEPFSLIVSDLTMPNLDGFGLLEKIRSSHLPHVRDLPVIIITGANDTEATMQRATAAGATDFIGKPFDSVHLLARTQAHASSYSVKNTLTDENISLEDRSMVDPLTGLTSDSAFREQGSAQLAYAIRHKTALALACIEIDNFGDLVKQHDNDAAELVIKSVGSALAANIRKEDTAARTGRARFALLLPGMNISGVNALSERIAGDIGKHAVIVGGKRVRFTVSVGIASPDIRPDTGFDDLLAAAGDGLKQAIERGGNLVMHDDALQGSAEPDSEWTPETHAAEPVSGREQEEALPDFGDLQIETLESLFGSDNETETELGEILLADEPAYSAPVEPAASAGFDERLAAESVTEEVEETIVITSPYSLFDLDDVEISDSEEVPGTAPETGNEAAAFTETAQEAASSGIQTAPATDIPVKSGNSETTQARPGAFRRLLRVLFCRRD